MLTVRFNNEIIVILPNQTLTSLLSEKGFANQPYAIALNRQFIPHSQHANTQLKENDVIEIIMPMQGG